jgi:hypothetical protein
VLRMGLVLARVGGLARVAGVERESSESSESPRQRRERGRESVTSARASAIESRVDGSHVRIPQVSKRLGHRWFEWSGVEGSAAA